MSAAPTGAATALLRAACALGLLAAVLTVGDTIAAVLRISANRPALQRDYAASTGSSLDRAHLVIGAAMAGGFIAGLALTAAVATLALLALRAGRGVRTGLVVCTLLVLPGALGGPLALGRAAVLVAALGCVLAPPAAAAFDRRRAAREETAAGT